MWGFDLHSWEQIMLWSLGGAAIAALAVTLSTTAVVFLQKEEAAASKHELELYKLDAGKKITSAEADIAKANEEISKANEGAAKANARALEAQLALEKFKAPRRLSSEQQAAIVERIKIFSGQKFDMAVNTGDPEAGALLDALEKMLIRAGWEQVDWRGGDVVSPRPSGWDDFIDWGLCPNGERQSSSL